MNPTHYPTAHAQICAICVGTWVSLAVYSSRKVTICLSVIYHHSCARDKRLLYGGKSSSTLLMPIPFRINKYGARTILHKNILYIRVLVQEYIHHGVDR